MGALIPLAISLAPEIANWLFGSTAEHATQAVATAVESITGTADPVAAQTVLSNNPDALSDLRVRLAQIAADQSRAARQAELDDLAARIKDTADARAQTVALAASHSAIAFGAPVVSSVVLITFAIVMWLALTKSIPSGSETILNVLLGTLAAMATSVVSYWVGSSAGSARKENILAEQARR